MKIRRRRRREASISTAHTGPLPCVRGRVESIVQHVSTGVIVGVCRKWEAAVGGIIEGSS